MKKNKLSSLIILGVLVFTLSACGGSSQPTTAPETQTETTEVSEGSEDLKDSETSEVAETTEKVALTGKRIEPLPATLSLDNINEIEDNVMVSFEGKDISVEDGKLTVRLDVYRYEIFDMVDIEGLDVGDIVVVNGEEVVVDEIEKGEKRFTVNGGLTEGGRNFELDDIVDDVYYEAIMDLGARQIYLGEITVQADENFEFIDNSDLNNVGLISTADEFVAEFMGTDKYFINSATTARLQYGKLVSITFDYVP